jgi:hypothetical protein
VDITLIFTVSSLSHLGNLIDMLKIMLTSVEVLFKLLTYGYAQSNAISLEIVLQFDDLIGEALDLERTTNFQGPVYSGHD